MNVFQPLVKMVPPAETLSIAMNVCALLNMKVRGVFLLHWSACALS